MPDPKPSRESFNQVAVAYDAIRPGYLPRQIEDIIAFSGIPLGGAVLEVGCGTGQATLPFARRGYAMLCLDIGPDMLAIASEKLRNYPNARLIQAAFEDWHGQPGRFDLIISATAFHWIPPEIGYPKAASLLKPGGALAVFSNEHQHPLGGFFTEVQEIYQRFSFAKHPADPSSTEDVIRAKLAEIRAMGLFASVAVYTYPWKQRYSSDQYIRLLDTYSDHRAMQPAARQALYQQIQDLIDREHGGAIEKDYLAVTYLCQR